MQSDTTTPSPQVANNAATIGPSAQGILASLKDADSPLAFIQANIKPKEPSNFEVPAIALAEATERRKSEPPNSDLPKPTPEATPSAAPDVYDVNPKETKDVKEPEVPVSAVLPTESETASLGDDKEDNFKRLRNKLGETSTVLKEKDKEIEQLQNKVKRYENGEEFPDVIKQLQDENTKLSRYEKIVALKTSDEYEDKFIKPINETKERLADIAADYGIPGAMMDKALNITNKRELNTFLSSHFDDVGALEVKQLITNAQELQNQAKAAEAEPSKVLEELRLEHEEFKKQEFAKNINSIITSSKDAWVDSLLRIRREGRIQELIPIEGDEEHNKMKVERVLRAAGTEYGKLVRMLAENGLKVLPKDVGHAIARMVHLAFASSMSIEAKEKAEQEAAELRDSSERTTRYGRPLGAAQRGGASEAPAPSKPKTLEDAADQILNKVMRR